MDAAADWKDRSPMVEDINLPDHKNSLVFPELRHSHVSREVVTTTRLSELHFDDVGPYNRCFRMFFTFQIRDFFYVYSLRYFCDSVLKFCNVFFGMSRNRKHVNLVGRNTSTHELQQS